jgi:hypothetical protein
MSKHIVICIDEKNENLTYGKKYTVDMFVVDRLSNKINDHLVKITNDNGKVCYYSENYFIRLDKFREDKLNILLNE